MGTTQITGLRIADGTIKREDLDPNSTVRRIVAGSYIDINPSTGVGDVVISLNPSAITRIDPVLATNYAYINTLEYDYIGNITKVEYSNNVTALYFYKVIIIKVVIDYSEWRYTDTNMLIRKYYYNYDARGYLISITDS